MCDIVPYQPELRQALPDIIGNIDYAVFRETLLRIEELMQVLELDKQFIAAYETELDAARRERVKKAGKKYRECSLKEKLRVQMDCRVALRCCIARHLTGESYRAFSRRLADSPLLQYFCRLDRLGPIRVPSKSTLQRYDQMVPESVVRDLITEANQSATTKATELRLEQEITLDELYYDTTCCQTNIHVPVDWVLLRDVIRTLMKAVGLIRKAGLKNRMKEPKVFLKQINTLCMRMSHTRRRKEIKKPRKKIVRLMKKLVQKVERHAEKHRILLVKRWAETDYSEAQMKQIVSRIDSVIEQLPAALAQVHERIIGERRVPNNAKILSLYEPDTRVIVRGKSGAEVEYGNTLLLGEQSDGIIVDWQLYQGQAPADSKLLPDGLQRFEASYGNQQPKSVTTDRGFYSKQNSLYLEEKEITDCTCPRSVIELIERLTDKSFRQHQCRRAQTEGRVAILKNNFLGRPLRSKGFVSRELNVAWGILAHNLWVISRLPHADQRQRKKAA